MERLSLTASIQHLQIATQPATAVAPFPRDAEALLQHATGEAAAKFDRVKAVFQKLDEPQGQHAFGEPNRSLNLGDGLPPFHARIDLPELEGKADQRIDAGNVRALQAIYAGEMVEERRVPQGADRLVELFQNGLLSIATQGSGSVARRNAFFTGSLLGVDDLQGEQQYRGKDRP